MQDIQLNIKRKSEQEFEFTLYKKELANELHEERAMMVRFMDEAIDALMRCSQNMEYQFLPCVPESHRVHISTSKVQFQQ